MKITVIIGFLTVLAFALCTSQPIMAQSASAETPPPAKIIVPLGKNLVLGLPEIGTRTPDTIRVFVRGQVNRPGIYYFPPGVTVSTAIERAGGLTQFATWSVSFVLRPIDAEQAEIIKFPRKPKPADLNVPLKEDDRLCLAEILD